MNIGFGKVFCFTSLGDCLAFFVFILNPRRMKNGWVCLSLLVTSLLLAGYCGEPQTTPMPPLSDISPIHIADGPTLLHGNVVSEWGGHIFSYVITGENYVFWSAMLYESCRTSRTILIGQHPRKGVNRAPIVTSVSPDAPDVYNSSLPLLVRTPDGFVRRDS